MNKKIIQILEFDKVKEQFLAFLTTAHGKKELEELEPLSDRRKIQPLFDELSEFEKLIQENGQIQLSKTGDISEILRRLELDAQLSGREFVEIKKIVQQGLNILRYFEEAENVNIPALEELISKFTDLSTVHKALEIFDNSGTLYDNASPVLLHIR